MKIHEQDFRFAKKISAEVQITFPKLTEIQIKNIEKKSNKYTKWLTLHPTIHNCISIALTCGIFILDFTVLLYFPVFFGWETNLIESPMTVLVLGVIHGWIMCGMTTYFVHEAAAHNLFLLGKSKPIIFLKKLGRNICRLSFADPEYYSQGHRRHHQYFSSEKDGSFSNFVRFRRLLLSLIPASPLMNYSDFFPWRSQEMTASRKASSLFGKLYIFLLALFMVPQYGFLFTIICLVMIGAWLSYVLDRIRESCEHFAMPLDRYNGTRQLGLGFVGLFLGGGPWGQPCHMSHHLAPGLPWYLQLRLHFDLKRILSPEQKNVFFLKPFIGFPMLAVKFFSINRQFNKGV